MLGIVESYHPTQFQGKLKIETQEMPRNGPDLDCQNFFIKIVDRHCSKISSVEGNWLTQDRQEMAKNGPYLGRQNFFIKIVGRHCSKLSSVEGNWLTQDRQ